MTAPPPGLRSALRAELRKLMSLRSTYAILGAVVAMGIGVGTANLASLAGRWPTMRLADRAALDPVSESFAGLQFAELALGALGVLAICPEYGTGLIRVTFLAVPDRRRVFVAKAFVLTAVVAVVGEVTAFACYLAGHLAAGGRLPAPAVTSAVGVRAVAAAGLYLTVVTLVGFGLGVLFRHPAAALSAMVGLVFLAWPLARAFESITYLPARLLLVNAADVLTASHPVTGPHPERVPSLGVAVLDLVGYLVVFLGLGLWRIQRDPSGSPGSDPGRDRKQLHFRGGQRVRPGVAAGDGQRGEHALRRGCSTCSPPAHDPSS